MSQFKTFVLPSESDAASEGALNAFLRSHRIVSVVEIVGVAVNAPLADTMR